MAHRVLREAVVIVENRLRQLLLVATAPSDGDAARPTGRLDTLRWSKWILPYCHSAPSRSDVGKNPKEEALLAEGFDDDYWLKGENPVGQAPHVVDHSGVLGLVLEHSELFGITAGLVPVFEMYSFQFDGHR